MPFKSEKISIAGSRHDRRRKLTDQQRREIIQIYNSYLPCQTEIARMYGVSVKAVSFILFPERYAQSQAYLRERQKNGHYKRTKDEQREVMRNYRAHKQGLFLQGKI